MRTNPNKLRRFIGVLFCFILLQLTILGCAQAQAKTSEQEEWLQSKLRQIENQYNSGIMLLSFIEGEIPWDQFTVSGLPSGISAETWRNDLKGSGYPVDNTGIRYTKFPQYDGIHFVNVTVNGVEAIRAGILVPDEGNGSPAYYYMTQNHVNSDSHDGSGSHTGSISALLLPENTTFQVNYAVND